MKLNTQNAKAPALVVLAAGIGRRYGGLKQIEPVGPSGEIVIDYSIFDAIAAGFSRVVFVIRRDIEDSFRSTIEPHFAGRIPISYAFQETQDVPAGFAHAARSKPWGTGHALYACRHEIRSEPFGVINADDFYGRRSFELLASRLQNIAAEEDHYCLVGFVLRNTLSEHGPVSRGVCEVRDGRLVSVTERHKIVPHGQGGATCPAADGNTLFSGDEIVSMNLWGFTPNIFAHLDNAFRRFLPAEGSKPDSEFMLPAVVDELIHAGRARVDVLTSPEKWLGVTYPDDKARVAEGVRGLIRRGIYSERLWT